MTVGRLHHTYCPDAPAGAKCSRNLREIMPCRATSRYGHAGNAQEISAEIHAERFRDARRRLRSHCAATALSSNGMTRSARIWNAWRPLPGDEHGIAATSACERRFDRGSAVGLDANLAGLVKAGQEVAQDLARVFGAGVAERQDHAVGAGFSDGGQPTAFGTVAAAVTAQDTVDAAGGDGSQGGQGLSRGWLESGPRRSGRRSPDPQRPLSRCPATSLDRLEAGNDRGPVDSEAPGQCGCGQAQVAAREPIKGRWTATSRSNPCSSMRVPEPSNHSSRAETSTAAAGLATGSSAKATRRASRLTPPSISAFGIVGVHDRQSRRDHLAKQLGFGPSISSQCILRRNTSLRRHR